MAMNSLVYIFCFLCTMAHGLKPSPTGLRVSWTPTFPGKFPGISGFWDFCRGFLDIHFPRVCAPGFPAGPFRVTCTPILGPFSPDW